MYGIGKVSPAAHASDDYSNDKLYPYFATFVKFCDTTSAHGFKWCLRIRSRVARRSLITILFLLAAVSPLTLVWNFVEFLTEASVNDNMAFKTARRIRYPNITVCDRKFFSKRRLSGMR